MAEHRPSSFAFSGSGDAESENFIPLLDSNLPEDPEPGVSGIGAVYRPTRVPRANSGLGKVVTWLEGELGKRNVQASDDLVASLLHRREEGDDVTLVMVWPEEPDDDEQKLVLFARAHDIRVVDLNGAFDDLQWEPEQPEVQEDPAEAETAPAAALAKITELVPDDVADALLVALRAFVTDVAVEVFEQRSGTGGGPAKPSVNISGWGNLSPIEVDASRTYGKSSATQTPAVADESLPPFDGPYKDPALPTTAYFVNPDGRYRIARARPRKGDERVLLTKAEVDALDAKNLIDA